MENENEIRHLKGNMRMREEWLLSDDELQFTT